MYAHARAPVRIGIAGGGTDLPAWTKVQPGHCLSLAIQNYTHAVAIARPDGQVVASYLKRDVALAATEIANGLIRESALMHGWEDGFEVHTLSELSSHGSGLGVSSSIAVALGACFQRLATLRNRRPRMGDFRNEMMRDEPVRAAATTDGTFAWELDPAAYLQFARNAWTVEIDRLHRPIGRQDHMAASYGGLRLYRFEGDNASVERVFSAEDAEWVAKHIVLLKLPEGHDSRAILSGVKTLDMLKPAALAVDDAVRGIIDRDARLLGRALYTGQMSKALIPGATNVGIQEIIAALVNKTGVHGCKVAGAGGGGHIIVACEPHAHEAIAKLTQMPVLTVQPDLTGVRSEGWA